MSRKHRFFFLFSVLAILLPLFYLVNHYKPTAQATWFDDSYAYRKKLTIGNSGAAVASARKVLIEVDTAALTTDKMQADCDDTRFTDINGKVLRFTIDVGAGACDTSSTDYYVELPNVTTGDNIIYMYYGNPAAISATTPSLLGPSWTTASSAPMPVAAYQPVGAASLTSSYSNLSNPGTYDAAPGTAPTFAATTGWTFNGSTQYLTTGLNPGSTAWSMIIRFSGTSEQSKYMAGSFVSGASNFYLVPFYTGVGVAYGNGGGLNVTPGLTTSGVIAFAGKNAYRDGVSDGTLPVGTSVPAYPIFFGSLNVSGDPTGFYWAGNIQAAAIYNSTLTSGQISAITTAMNNLSAGSDAGIATFTPTSGPTLASEEKTPGPAAYWKLDDGQGTTAQDSTVNNNDGTVSGATWTEESRCIDGKCLQFDGSDDFVSAGSALVPSTGAFTVSMWTKFTDFAATRGLLGQYYDVLGNRFLLYVGTNGKAALQIGGTTLTGTRVLSANIWYHLVFQRDGSNNVTIFINGVQDATSTNSTAIDTQATTVGKYDEGGGTGFMKGFMDDFKVYTYARTAAQIKADFAKGGAKGASAVLGAQESEALSEGLVGYWKMDELAANGCTGGTNDNCDASGNGNDGAWTGNATTGTSKYGSSLNLDGTGDYASVADSTSLDISGAITLSAWVRTTGSNDYSGIIQKATGGANHGYAMSLDTSGGVRADFFNDSVYITPKSSTNVEDGNWHHVIATYDGTTAKMYVDGVVGSTTATGTGYVTLNNAALLIGSDACCGGRDFNGRIDETRVYNRALSYAEIQQLYNYAPAPVLHLKMDEKTGQAANDSSSAGNNGTLGASSSAESDDPTWVNGKFGSALSFDGSNDYVSAGDINAVDGVAGMTVSAWVKPTALADLKAIVSKFSTTGWIIETGTGGLGDNNDIVIAVSGSEYAYTSGDVLSVGTWTHVSMVLDGFQTGDSNRFKAYINGKEQSLTYATTIPATTSSTSHTVRVGAADEGRFLNTVVDDVRIYNYPRTAKQIVEDMNAGHPAGGSPLGSQVAYWKFDEGRDNACSGGTNDACNSGFGGTGLDGAQSGMAVPATSTSGWTNSGKFGKALNFDGSNDYISIADNSALDLTSNLMVSAWIKTSKTTGEVIFSHYNSSAPYTGFGFGVDGNGCQGGTAGELTFWSSGQAAWVAAGSDSVVNDGNWHHVAATYNGTTLKMYKDGVEVDSRGLTAPGASTNSAYVGVDGGLTSGCYFSGSIDDVKVYNGSLSSSEIKVDYNRGQSLVLGAMGNNSSYATHAANQEYCVPGDSTSCAAPVGEWKLDEKTGTSAFDTSGNGNTGTLTNGPTWVTGKVGSAIDFDGTDDHLVLSNSASLDFTSTYTISAWIKPRQFRNYEMMFARGNSSAGDIEAYIRADSLVVVHNRNNGGTLTGTTGTTNPSANVWTYLTVTYDTTNKWKIYYNGVLQTSGSITVGAGEAPLDTDKGWHFGQTDNTGVYSATNEFDGAMDNIRFYDYVRTPAQVAYDYNRGGPVGHWQLDECQGETAYDKSGNSNTGTVILGGSGETDFGNCTASSTAWGDGATGKFNSSLSFDGADDYVEMSHSASLAITGDATIAGWVYADTLSTYHFIFTKESSSGWSGATPSLYINDDTNLVRATRGNASSSEDGVSSSTALTTGSWYHIAATFEGTTGKIYINGLLSATDTVSGTFTDSGTQARIGGRVNAAASFWDGKIDDVRVYNYALTASQVKNVMNQAAGVRYGPSTGQP